MTLLPRSVPGSCNLLWPRSLIIVFGFFFSVVSSRITGELGSSSCPISGMAIATLMGTCLLFVLLGWTGHAYTAVALSIGSVVCIASSNAGTTSQDLKTGFLVGATPWKQQVALMVGVLTCVFVIGWTVLFLNRNFSDDASRRSTTVTLPAGARRRADRTRRSSLPGARASGGAGRRSPTATYLVDDAGRVHYEVVAGHRVREGVGAPGHA